MTYHTARLDRCDALYHKTRKAMVSDLVTGYRLSHVVRGHREARRRHQAVLEGQVYVIQTEAARVNVHTFRYERWGNSVQGMSY